MAPAKTSLGFDKGHPRASVISRLDGWAKPRKPLSTTRLDV